VAEERRRQGVIKFNISLSDPTYAVLGVLATWMDASMAEVIRESLAVLWFVIRECREGNKILIRRGDQVTELVVPYVARMQMLGLAPRDEVISGMVEDPRDATSRDGGGLLFGGRSCSPE
jgi:hypothetical protein